MVGGREGVEGQYKRGLGDRWWGGGREGVKGQYKRGWGDRWATLIKRKSRICVPNILP